MTHTELTLAPRAPFLELPKEPVVDPCILVAHRDLALASVLVRKGQRSVLAQRLREALHIELPAGPRRCIHGSLALAGIGPDAWLASEEGGGHALAAQLRETIGDLASISEQSDSYAVLRLEGPRLRDVLQKLVAIDLHPRVFEANHVAVTAAGHIGVTLWGLQDARGEDAEGASVFELAVFRSLATDFGRLLSESAAELGLGLAARR